VEGVGEVERGKRRRRKGWCVSGEGGEGGCLLLVETAGWRVG
jgi:hypothetical protein